MDLGEVHKLIVADCREGITFLTAGYPMTDSGKVLAELSERFQGLAICHLLVRDDVEQFRENLIRSGYARRYFLRKSKEEGNVDDRHRAISRTEAFFDALVAGELPLAQEIAARSIGNWDRRWEYEDDFCFVRFLHLLSADCESFPTQEAMALLEQFEAALEGDATPQFHVCTALASKDGEQFVEAMHELTEWNEGRMEEQRSTITEPYFYLWPKCFLYIEGLAILQLAQLIGMEPDEQFCLCPGDARLTPKSHKCRDLFAELEAVLAHSP